MPDDYRRLRSEPLAETAERLASRIVGRFPDAGLGHVALAVRDVTRETADTVETINRPAWGLRLGLGAAVVVVVAVAAGMAVAIGPSRETVLEIARLASGLAVWLGAIGWFFWTLETRLKRGKALRALHRLRGLAHLIDMHQLAKNPECPGGDEQQYDRAAMAAYLGYCSELLAILSKIGQLYVEDFPDGTTLAAADQLENLTTGLSSKIWQKVMILEEVTGPAPPA